MSPQIDFLLFVNDFLHFEYGSISLYAYSFSSARRRKKRKKNKKVKYYTQIAKK